MDQDKPSLVAMARLFFRLFVSVAALCGLLWSAVSQARVDAPLAAVALSAMSGHAQETYRLILAGGPFPYEKDGIVFANRERILPRQARGYYREYTVPVPGAQGRGAQRMVCGGVQPKTPDICYFTQDHYASFSRILP
ncbi:MAG: ribonuclease domain-containing protein [Leptothrix ochracea]|uniref:ribonuclease domain-containing protein n=2 Tax=Leptothrix ochracea TaxID=735331 RepID=UPI0034E28DBD